MKTKDLVNVARAVANDSGVAIKGDLNETNIAPLRMALEFTPEMNAFLNVLVNKFAMTIVRDRLFNNPLKMLKKGGHALGTIVEELGVNPASVNEYDVDATTEVLTQVKPDVKAVYHTMNSTKFTKVTITEPMLEKAFSSWGEFGNFITSIINSLYTGAELYEFETMKGLFTTAITNEHIVVEELAKPTNSQETADAFLAKIREYNGKFKFPSVEYNKYADLTGAVGEAYKTWCPLTEQVLIIRSDILAKLDVYALARAFNMEREDFISQVIEIDSFGTGEFENVNAVLCDRTFVQTYDNLSKSTEYFNPESLARTYWYHFWNTFDISPLADCVAFVEPTVEPTTNDNNR